MQWKICVTYPFIFTQHHRSDASEFEVRAAAAAAAADDDNYDKNDGVRFS